MKKMTFLYHHHSSNDKHTHTSLVHTLTDIFFFLYALTRTSKLHGMIFHSGRSPSTHTHSYAAAAAPATQMKRKSIFLVPRSLSRSSLCFVVDSRLFNAFSSRNRKRFRQKMLFMMMAECTCFLSGVCAWRGFFLSQSSSQTNFNFIFFQCLLATTHFKLFL